MAERRHKGSPRAAQRQHKGSGAFLSHPLGMIVACRATRPTHPAANPSDPTPAGARPARTPSSAGRSPILVSLWCNPAIPHPTRSSSCVPPAACNPRCGERRARPASTGGSPASCSSCGPDIRCACPTSPGSSASPPARPAISAMPQSNARSSTSSTPRPIGAPPTSSSRPRRRAYGLRYYLETHHGSDDL